MKHLTSTNQVLCGNFRIDFKGSIDIDSMSRIERCAIATSGHEAVCAFFKYNPRRQGTFYVFEVDVSLIIERIEYGNNRLYAEAIKNIREVNLLDV